MAMSEASVSPIAPGDTKPINLLPTSTKNYPMSIPSIHTESIEVMPIKDAAVKLGFPYKQLLRLCREGFIPAVDLNARRGCKRPRFVVVKARVVQFLNEEAERQAAMRRAPVRGINLRRLVQPH